MNLWLWSLSLRTCVIPVTMAATSALWLSSSTSSSLLLSLSLSVSIRLPPFTASNSTVSRPPSYISMAQLVVGQATRLFQGDAAYGNHGDVTMLNPHVLHFRYLTCLLLPHRTAEENKHPWMSSLMMTISAAKPPFLAFIPCWQKFFAEVVH